MIYLFNNNEEMIRIIPNSAIKRMYQTQTLTDENYISDRLDVEIQALNDEELSELEYMAIDDIENPQRFHYYFIAKETTEHQVTSLTGVQSGIEELRKTPVYDMRPTNLSPKLIADRLLEGTNWQAGYTTNDVGTISTNFYYTDVFSALKKMCMAFDIEMQFFVEITTNRIGARYIEFRKRTGKSVGKRVVYGHNALKIVKEVEKTNTVTALIGRGRGVQVSESDAGNIGYGRKIGFENVEWNTSSGAPVDKPLGQEFVEIPELTLQYGIKNSNGTVRPKIGFVEFQDEESETRLIDRTYNALLELSRPQVLLETSSIYLPDTGIGDTINVVRHDRDLRYQTRVFEITWDRLANRAVDMKLGDRLGESENKRISRISNQVSGNISTELGSTIEELVDRLTTADGKNTNWYTDYDPMENPETMGLVRVNDNWYQPDPEYEGEFILKQWNGEMWIEILRTSGNPELVRRFEEIEQQAQDLAGDIEASDQKADEAKEEAGLAKGAVDAFEQIIGTDGEKIANMVMTDSMFSTRVLESIDIGGRNYALGTTSEMQYNQGIHQWSGNMRDNTSQARYTLDELDAKVGDVYTASIYIGDGGGFGSGLRIDNQRGSKHRTNQISNGWASVTFTVDSSDTYFNFYYSNNNNGTQGYEIEACKFKIEKGNKRTDWTPSPEDTPQQVSEIKQTADAIQALVGTTNDSVARAVMTSNLWETEVSKVIDSELVQEYETVISPVNVINAEEHNSGEAFSLGKYFYYSGDDVDSPLQSGVNHVLEITMPATQNKGQLVAVQAKAYSSTEWKNIGVSFNLPAGQFRIVHEFTSLVFATSVADYRLIIQDDGNPSVTTVYSLKVYRNEEVQVPIVGEETGAISSQITQLYNMINLSILGKDGAMSRIAMGEEGIQIDGKLLHITAKTYIDDAVIKSAMIDTLDAGKITTGELNASLIRVVNLDANSITGNEASFIQALFSGTKSTLQITGSGVNVLDNSGRSSTYLDSSGIEFSRAGINLGKLQYVTNTTESGDLYGMHGFAMRPNRDSYFAVSYFPTAGATSSLRSFAVSGRTGNIYLSGLLKPSEQHPYGLNITWGTITGGSTNVEIWNHNKTGGIHIANGDLHYITSSGKWRSLNANLG